MARINYRNTKIKYYNTKSGKKTISKLTKSEIVNAIAERKRKIIKISETRLVVSEEDIRKLDFSYDEVNREDGELYKTVNRLREQISREKFIVSNYHKRKKFLEDKKSGLFSGLFFKESSIDNLVDEYNAASNDLPNHERELVEALPRYEFIHKVTTSMSALNDIEKVRAEVGNLERRLKYFLKKEDDLISLKNKAAVATKARRAIASSIKRQLEKYPFCPYCFGDLGTEPHADHIYPVSKGGESSQKNMVFVCSSCNSRKGNKTLTSFIKEYNLDRDKIEAELDVLGKDY